MKIRGVDGIGVQTLCAPSRARILSTLFFKERRRELDAMKHHFRLFWAGREELTALEGRG